tara:strand:+ start:125 stop:385 length:261 start_codon:yes stop_codon:yes gene_type:complete
MLARVDMLSSHQRDEEAMTNQVDDEFRRIDEILSNALEAFRTHNIDQRLSGSALLEIGVASLIKAGEQPASVLANVEDLLARLRPS